MTLQSARFDAAVVSEQVASRDPEEIRALSIFDEVAKEGHEQILYGYARASGLKTIVAIHSTALGPALGGTRFVPYASEDDDVAMRVAENRIHDVGDLR